MEIPFWWHWENPRHPWELLTYQERLAVWEHEDSQPLNIDDYNYRINFEIETELNVIMAKEREKFRWQEEGF